jgi:hypothetical protein
MMTLRYFIEDVLTNLNDYKIHDICFDVGVDTYKDYVVVSKDSLSRIKFCISIKNNDMACKTKKKRK